MLLSPEYSCNWYWLQRYLLARAEMLTSSSGSLMNTVGRLLTLPATAFDRSSMTASTGSTEEIRKNWRGCNLFPFSSLIICCLKDTVCERVSQPSLSFLASTWTKEASPQYLTHKGSSVRTHQKCQKLSNQPPLEVCAGLSLWGQPPRSAPSWFWSRSLLKIMLVLYYCFNGREV